MKNFLEQRSANESNLNFFWRQIESFIPLQYTACDCDILTSVTHTPAPNPYVKNRVCVRVRKYCNKNDGFRIIVNRIVSCIRNRIRGWVGHLVRVRYQPSSTPFVRYGGIIVTRRPSYFFLGHGILISYPISCAFWVQTCVAILVSRRRIAGASDGSLQSPLVDGSRRHSVPIVSLLAEYFVCAVLRQRERERAEEPEPSYRNIFLPDESHSFDNGWLATVHYPPAWATARPDCAPPLPPSASPVETCWAAVESESKFQSRCPVRNRLFVLRVDILSLNPNWRHSRLVAILCFALISICIRLRII